MTTDEVKQFLALYRPGTDDANAPPFRDALARLEDDPEMRTWFASQCALSASLGEKLKEIPVPPNLRADILANVAGCGQQQSSRSDRTWPRLLAMAACLLLTAAGMFLWFNRFVPSGPQTYAAYRSDMGVYLSRIFRLDYRSEDLDDIKAWLATKHGFTGYAVPAALAEYPSLGCEVIDWHDNKVVLICFDVNGELVHLFTLPLGDKGTLPGAPTAPQPGAIAQSGDWHVTGWNENGRLYLAMTEGDAAFLKRALGI